MTIRDEEPRDYDAVRAVNEAAFETSAEADLVEALREQAEPRLSLVAEIDGAVVGHILFSPVTAEATGDALLLGLAPMAVTPDRQKQGVGSTLVNAGLGRCKDLGAAGVVVLGHVDYYPRFGFAPASRFGIRSEYEVPDEVFMALELVECGLGDVSGLVRYHPAFSVFS